MIGRKVKSIFDKIFALMYLNLIFWALTLLGLVILGIGPALRTITYLLADYGWNYDDYSWSEAFDIYKSLFIKANFGFYMSLGILFVLGFNLFGSLQFSSPWLLFLRLFLTILMIQTTLVSIYCLLLRAHYEVSFKQAIYLSIMQLFNGFFQTLMLVLGMTISIASFVIFPPLGLLIGVPGILAWVNFNSTKWYKEIDDNLLEENPIV